MSLNIKPEAFYNRTATYGMLKVRLKVFALEPEPAISCHRHRVVLYVHLYNSKI